MAMAAWGGLRLDLVRRILTHLPCLAHRTAFSAVCFNWRAVADKLPPPLWPGLPWLLFPPSEALEPGLFCILCGTTHRAFLGGDVRAARCCGSCPGGWLVLALPQGGGHALHNLHTGMRLAVPSFLHTAGGTGESGVTIRAAALSAAPVGNAPCLAAVLAKCASTIAFWRPGMQHLSSPTPAEPQERASWREMLPSGLIADVIYYDNGQGLEGFHVLTSNEELLVYSPELATNVDGTLPTRLVTYRFPEHRVTRDASSRYLLNFFGDLLMVVKFVLATDKWERFHFFRFVPILQAGNHGDREASWVRIDFPGHVAMILGRCSSMAFLSRGVALDGLYFAGNVFDTGKCTLVEGQQQLEIVGPIRPPACYPPVWFFH